MPSYYPVYLNVRERRCVVIGGGHSAERKVLGLLESGALVSVISPQLSTVLGELAGQGTIIWEAREYKVGDLQGAFLAIAATDNPDAQKAVAKEAELTGVLLNVIDAADMCTFISPAVVRRGEVTFAISTGGLSPALARKLRTEMQESSFLLWADLAEMVSEVRLSLFKRGVRPDPDHWQECLDKELLELFHSGQQAEAKERLLKRLQEQPVISQGLSR
ncbi:MAG: bifunctional precorrin-2 dehydrogenase/sirohydrochlorin ferrochelatase [Dehalococcoidia bacterium]